MKAKHHIPRKLSTRFRKWRDRVYWANVDWFALEGEALANELMWWGLYKGIPQGVYIDINTINGKPIAFTDNGDECLEYVPNSSKPKFTLPAPAISSSTDARISAIITERLKRNLHRLSAPYPHFDLLPANENLICESYIFCLASEVFLLSIFSRPPPKQLNT